MGVKANLPSKMTQEIRGGTRGGRDQFSWDAIKVDKHRINYLGNSVKAVSGRWSEEKDAFWYTRGGRTMGPTEAEAKAREEEERRAELAMVKAQEQIMLQQLLAQNKTAEEPSRMEASTQPRHSASRSSEVSRSANRPARRRSPEMRDSTRMAGRREYGETIRPNHDERYGAEYGQRYDSDRRGRYERRHDRDRQHPSPDRH